MSKRRCKGWWSLKSKGSRVSKVNEAFYATGKLKLDTSRTIPPHNSPKTHNNRFISSVHDKGTPRIKRKAPFLHFSLKSTLSCRQVPFDAEIGKKLFQCASACMRRPLNSHLKQVFRTHFNIHEFTSFASFSVSSFVMKF